MPTKSCKLTKPVSSTAVMKAKPSAEASIHIAVVRARGVGAGAVLHTHSDLEHDSIRCGRWRHCAGKAMKC